MSQTLREIAELLQLNGEEPQSEQMPRRPQQVKPKKVQLIYAYNGTGKTRLSREFKELVSPETLANPESDDLDAANAPRPKILYYNAFTEDLFTWENDHDDYTDHKLLVRSNGLTEWLFPLLKRQGLDGRITSFFQEHTNTKITPVFNTDYTEIRFNLALGGDNNVSNLKISKGEESNFIWSVFHSMLDLAISVLSERDLSNRETNGFNELKYVFIDDPVSSLDDNHLIHSAVSLARLVKLGSSNLKFIISTHNPLFFNVLSNEFGNDRWDKDTSGKKYWKREKFQKYFLEKFEDGTLNFQTQPNDSPFSYHLHIANVIKDAIDEGEVDRYHFNLLRSLLEKTATFLGHNRWEMLLPKNGEGQPDEQCMRALNVYSHSQQSGDELPTPESLQVTKLEEIFLHLIGHYRFKSASSQPAETAG